MGNAQGRKCESFSGGWKNCSHSSIVNDSSSRSKLWPDGWNLGGGSASGRLSLFSERVASAAGQWSWRSGRLAASTTSAAAAAGTTSSRTHCSVQSRGSSGSGGARWCQARADTLKTGWPVSLAESLFLPEFPVRHKHSQRQFEVLSTLGSGAFGQVYRVREKRSDNEFALKVLSKSQVVREKAVAQVKDEVCIQTACGHHRFIVSCPRRWQTRHQLFVLEEYVCGGDMYSLWLKHGVLHEQLVRLFVAQLAIAIEFLHNAGVVYRDLKLQNVLLDARMNVQLTDFGLAKWLRHSHRTATICGTLRYMAPEVLDMQPYNHRVDWWSLGVLTHCLLTGQFPFESSSDSDNSTSSVHCRASSAHFVTSHSHTSTGHAHIHVSPAHSHVSHAHNYISPAHHNSPTQPPTTPTASAGNGEHESDSECRLLRRRAVLTGRLAMTARVSEPARHLVSRLLTVEPRHRLSSLLQLGRQAWFKDVSVDSVGNGQMDLRTLYEQLHPANSQPTASVTTSSVPCASTAAGTTGSCYRDGAVNDDFIDFDASTVADDDADGCVLFSSAGAVATAGGGGGDCDGGVGGGGAVAVMSETVEMEDSELQDEFPPLVNTLPDTLTGKIAAAANAGGGAAAAAGGAAAGYHQQCVTSTPVRQARQWPATVAPMAAASATSSISASTSGDLLELRLPDVATVDNNNNDRGCGGDNVTAVTPTANHVTDVVVVGGDVTRCDVTTAAAPTDGGVAAAAASAAATDCSHGDNFADQCDTVLGREKFAIVVAGCGYMVPTDCDVSTEEVGSAQVPLSLTGCEAHSAAGPMCCVPTEDVTEGLDVQRLSIRDIVEETVLLPPPLSLSPPLCPIDVYEERDGSGDEMPSRTCRLDCVSSPVCRNSFNVGQCDSEQIDDSSCDQLAGEIGSTNQSATSCDVTGQVTNTRPAADSSTNQSATSCDVTGQVTNTRPAADSSTNGASRRIQFGVDNIGPTVGELGSRACPSSDQHGLSGGQSERHTETLSNSHCLLQTLTAAAADGASFSNRVCYTGDGSASAAGLSRTGAVHCSSPLSSPSSSPPSSSTPSFSSTSSSDNYKRKPVHNANSTSITGNQVTADVSDDMCRDVTHTECHDVSYKRLHSASDDSDCSDICDHVGKRARCCRDGCQTTEPHELASACSNDNTGSQ